MRAIILDKIKNPVLGYIKEPEIHSEEEIKIKIKSVGLCGSDLQKICSDEDPKSYLKTSVLGHEFSGTVSNIGKKVNGFYNGQGVVGIPLLPCFRCEPCKNKSYNLCYNLETIGRTAQGAFSEYLVLPSKNLRSIPEGMEFDEVALTDVVAVATHIYNLSKRQKNKHVCIMGDGAIGLICLQLFNNFGNKVYVVGKHQENIIKSFSGIFLNEKEKSNLEDSCFDLVVEAVGRKQDKTLEEAIRITKPNGNIIVAGVFPPEYVNHICLRNLFYKEIKLQGANSYNFSEDKDEFGEALSLMNSGIIKVKDIITHKLPLEKFQEGINLMLNKDKSKAIKIVYHL